MELFDSPPHRPAMDMPQFLVFDIETVPDVELGRRLHHLPADLKDEDVVRVMLHAHEQKTGDRFLPLVQHRVIAIAGACQNKDDLRIAAFGRAESPEKELLETFFHFIDSRRPILVSWNGGGFDLPVLHYRALRHGVSSEFYWEVGERHQAYRYNNYQSRYHHRHLDLMDKLSAYQLRASASLNQVASLLGAPGKTGVDGSRVCDMWLAGDIEPIRQYCELDVINTYIVYLRFMLIARHIDEDVYEGRIKQLREALGGSSRTHWREFAEQWSRPE